MDRPSVRVEESRFNCLSATTLKSIAGLTMIVDHIGVLLYPGEHIFRIIGRISFPIFCFLLVEGAFHTRNIWKYLLRLMVIGIISEPVYDYAFYHTLWYPKRSSIFLTLCLGLLMIGVCQRMSFYWERGIVLLVAVSTASFLGGDYKSYGIALIGIMYLARRELEGKWCFLYQGFGMLCMTMTFYPKLYMQWYCMLSLIPIFFYNNKKGCELAIVKYGFYILYPLHLIILCLLF